MATMYLFCSNLLGKRTNKIIVCPSSLDTTATSQEQASDDEDDELLALRIAALESIKIKEAKVIIVSIIWSPDQFSTGKGRCKEARVFDKVSPCARQPGQHRHLRGRAQARGRGEAQRLKASQQTRLSAALVAPTCPPRV